MRDGGHLVGSLCFAAVCALILQGCDKPSRVASEGENVHLATAHRPEAGDSIVRFDSLTPQAAPRDTAFARANSAQSPTDDVPPWLAELLRAPDPNVRIQGLDAWARQPTASLDPVTYALVDPDESVRARAQEILEHELARR